MDKQRVAEASSQAGSARTAAFQAILKDVVSSGSAPAYISYFRAVVDDSLPLSASRPAASALAQAIDFTVRKKLAELLSEEEEYTEAARVLAAIDTSRSGRTMTPAEIAEHCVHIAELFLEDDNTVDAQIYIKKASEVIHEAEDATLTLRYRVSYARIQDSQRKFLEAALKYYQISQIKDEDIEEGQFLILLTHAVKCVCLAKAGPQRSRMMDALYRDARAPGVEGFFMLEKMYREQIVRTEEVERFRALLMPHQKAELSGGMTVYDRAIVQHNMLAASRIYECVSFAELSVLLNISPRKAEGIAATMIAEDRLSASIDQVEGLLVFEGAKEMITTWDTTLKQILSSVNSCCDEIESKYPQLYA